MILYGGGMSQKVQWNGNGNWERNGGKKSDGKTAQDLLTMMVLIFLFFSFLFLPLKLKETA